MTENTFSFTPTTSTTSTTSTTWGIVPGERRRRRRGG
jgi:hypothetical protein